MNFKRKFLDNYASKGYNDHVETLRKSEYPNLHNGLEGSVYLDNAGSAIYASSLPIRYAKRMNEQIYSNPHSASSSPSSLETSKQISKLRTRILTDLFNISPSDLRRWCVIFTPNATGALKLVTENFPWSSDTKLGLLYESNHTSAIGCSLIASKMKSNIEFVFYENAENWIKENSNSLFIYPAQCNFTGNRYEIGKTIQRPRSRIIVDIASYLSTSVYDINEYDKAPDFMCLSFYKIFGFPTGVGALIAKRESLNELEKNYFGGGTVAAVSATNSCFFYQLRQDPISKFEDGTINFLSLLAIDEAISLHKLLFGSMNQISLHTKVLGRFLRDSLKEMKHANGMSLVRLYGKSESEINIKSETETETEINIKSKTSSYPALELNLTGPIVTFNLLRSDGSWIGYNDVARLAGIHEIHFRTGGMCNPGAIHSCLDISDSEIIKNTHSGHVCWDDRDIMNGKPTGAIRISIGAYNNLQDIIQVLKFLEEFFLEKKKIKIGDSINFNIEDNLMSLSNHAKLIKITLYPIKSCGGYNVSRWKVSPHGLKYDREWMIIDRSTGRGLSQKQYPKMCLIRPRIIDEKIMIISAPEMNDLEINIEEIGSTIETATTVCNDLVNSNIYESNFISRWFTSFLGIECTLSRICFMRHSRYDSKVKLRYSNESPFLLLSQESLCDLKKQSQQVYDIVPSFRGNFIISGIGIPYIEDKFSRILIQSERLQSRIIFDVLGRCKRCNMICVNQENGDISREPFSTLVKYRRDQGRVWFGIHLKMYMEKGEGETREVEQYINVGDDVEILKLQERDKEKEKEKGNDR